MTGRVGATAPLTHVDPRLQYGRHALLRNGVPTLPRSRARLCSMGDSPPLPTRLYGRPLCRRYQLNPVRREQ